MEPKSHWAIHPHGAPSDSYLFLRIQMLAMTTNPTFITNNPIVSHIIQKVAGYYLQWNKKYAS
jgi:hypothetical protein